MTWIIGSFLVTSGALTRILQHVRALRSNRKEITWWEPRDQIWTECRESESSEGHAADQVVSDEIPRGCKRWHPLAPGRWYGKKKSSLWVYVSPSISQLTTNWWTLFENKAWEIHIFIKKCVSFVHYLWLCFRLDLYYGYTTGMQK